TNAILGGALDCLLVLGSGFNERDTMHWTVRERSKGPMIHVNTDMDELTANADLGHVVPGSCHAFLDRMHARGRPRTRARGERAAPTGMARRDQGPPPSRARNFAVPGLQRTTSREGRSCCAAPGTPTRAASIRAVRLRHFATDYISNIVIDLHASLGYIPPSLAHRGASSGDGPWAERGVASRGGGS